MIIGLMGLSGTGIFQETGILEFPIPVWECSKCKEIIIAEEKNLPIDPTGSKKEVF